MKLTWNLVFKILIALFWIVGMIGIVNLFLYDSIDLQLSIYSIVVVLGLMSVVLNVIYRKKNFIIDYFIIFFLLQLLFYLSIF